MVVTFILLNITKPARGDAEVIVYPEKGLVDALNALKNSVQSGKFKVEFHQGKKCNNNYSDTVEPRFNEPLFNEVLHITNDTPHPCQNYSKLYGIELRAI